MKEAAFDSCIASGRPAEALRDSGLGVVIDQGSETSACGSSEYSSGIIGNERMRGNDFEHNRCDLWKGRV
jgi:hypothetical protein